MVDPATSEAADPSARELSLSAPERRLLERLRKADRPREESELLTDLGLPADVLRGSLQRLRAKHLLLVEEEHTERLELTERGREARSTGLPERRLLNALAGQPAPIAPSEVGERAGLHGEERSVAIGVLRRRGYLSEGVPLRLLPSAPAPSEKLPEESWLEAVESGGSGDRTLFDVARRRGLVRAERSTIRRWSVSPEGAQLPLPTDERPLLGALTAVHLREGSWKDSEFRPYDVRSDVPFVAGPASHPYARFLEEFAELLVGLGFEEAEGPLVETEFWNGDVLFMPQEHPARSVHDVFFPGELTGRAPPEPLLERVARVHEGRPLPGESAPLSLGWRVPYRPEVARHPVLRSQTTAVSAHYLAGRPRAPFRMFCLDRNFRPDALDVTHHVEFHQCEGVLAEEGTTLRELIGMFQALAEGIGIRELKIRPSYFPFTEPSIEGYIRHPQLGWVETFPGGLLRPEVLRPLGVEVPVAAWGIGVTRLAMVALRISDIRELFEDDLDRLTGRGE